MYKTDTIFLTLESIMITMYQKTSMTQDCASKEGMQKTIEKRLPTETLKYG